MDNMFILGDRLQKIRQIINKFGEDNFYISFSGGKDSTVLSHLIDHSLPHNKIPRVYANTGIDLNMVREFVFELQKKDDRIEIISPSVPIKPTLENDGYPFKSKEHSRWVRYYNKLGKSYGVKNYIGEGDKTLWRPCPKKLLYQFTEEFKNRLKISDMCCVRMKEEPLIKWSKINNRPYNINGIMRAEKGRRNKANCLSFTGNKLTTFQPMAPLTPEWENWYIDQYDIEICAIYKDPYNFERTGCKGCPFALHLQHELDTLEKYFPAERKQCEIIWKPVYDEYRRINYRLRGNENDE